jgi:hypothetical protein
MHFITARCVSMSRGWLSEDLDDDRERMKRSIIKLLRKANNAFYSDTKCKVREKNTASFLQKKIII